MAPLSLLVLAASLAALVAGKDKKKEDDDPDRWSGFARFARNGFSYRKGRKDQKPDTIKKYDTGQLISHQLQLVSAHLGIPQKHRRHYGHHTYMKAELLHSKTALNAAYACMAKHCRSQLETCNSDHECMGTLTRQMGRGYECDDDEYEETPDLLRPLLRCYTSACPVPEGMLWSVRKAALSANETRQVMALKEIALGEADKAGVNRSSLHRNRTFGNYPGIEDVSDDELIEMGAGHLVTHLHRVFARHMPEVYDRLRSLAMGADAEGGWGAALHGFSSRTLKLRVAELIEYNATKPANFSYKGLGIHRDYGSLITLSVALTDPEEYTGGLTSFFATCSHPAELAAPALGDTIIWPSWVRHGVSPVTRGVRRILVLEFWEFCTRPPTRVRGRPSEEKKDSDCTAAEDDRIEARKPKEESRPKEEAGAPPQESQPSEASQAPEGSEPPAACQASEQNQTLEACQRQDL